MDETPSEPPQKPSHRRLLWLAFWFVFLTTPLLAFVIMLGVRETPVGRNVPIGLMYLGSVFAGALAAAFILARLTSKTSESIASRTLIYALWICGMYMLFVFVGCAMI